MKKLILLMSLLVFSQFVQAQKVIRVKGNKVYFQKSGYSVKVGQELVVLSRGTDAASIEVIKAKRNVAVGKIVNGIVKVGYQVQLKKKSRRSKRRSAKRKSKSYRAKMGGYAGLGFYLIGELEFSDGSIFDFNNHMVLPLGFEIFFYPNLSGTLELVYAFSGGGNPTNLTGADEWDTSYMEFNGGLTYYLNDKFYARGSIGYTTLNLSGSDITGNYDYDISGLNFGFGGGLMIEFKESLNFKIDLGYRYASLTSASLSRPTGIDEGNPELSQSNVNLSFLTTFKF